jgi:hypothetical protein
LENFKLFVRFLWTIDHGLWTHATFPYFPIPKTLSMDNCINCERSIAVEFQFCPTCGQRTAVHRLNFHDITHDGLHYVTHADKGVLDLILHLAKYPGKVAREYVLGKRKKYFPPLNFFLLVAGIFVFSANFLQSFEPPVTDASLDQRIEGMKASSPAFKTAIEKSPTLKTKLKRVFIRQDRAQHFTAKYSNFIAMVATPLVSFICFLFYRKGRYTYVEHLVANLYFGGFMSLLYAVIMAPMNSAFHFSPLYFMGVFFAAEIGYRAWSYYGMFEKNSRAALLKAIGVQAVAVLGWGLISFSLIMLYITNGFWGLVN